MGGFPDVALMEDVEFSMRLKHWGRLLVVSEGVRVSTRRWECRGFARNVWLVIRLFLGYLIERRFTGPNRIRTDYYRKYYTGA